MLLFESRFKQREREVTLVTTVGPLTQSNSSFNTPDIKTILLFRLRRGTQLNKIKLLIFLQLFFLNLPLTLYLAYFVELNNTTTSSKAASQNHLFQFSHSYVLHSLKKGLGHFVFVLMFIWQASSSFNLIYTYGVMSFMLSPAKSWSLILVLYLFWRVHRPRMR